MSIKDDVCLTEAQLFEGTPGRSTFHTHEQVRGAIYRLALFMHDGRDLGTMPTFKVAQQKIPAARVERYLRALASRHESRDSAGWVMVVSHRKTPVARVWLMPLGMTALEARMAIHRQDAMIGQYLRYVGMPVATTRRLILGPDCIERELGLETPRTLWRNVRAARADMEVVDGDTLPDVSGRSSKGHAMVAVHAEIMNIAGKHARMEGAVAAVRTYLRTRTSIRAKTRDIEAYLLHAWPVARADVLHGEEIQRRRVAEGRAAAAGWPTLRVVGG